MQHPCLKLDSLLAGPSAGLPLPDTGFPEDLSGLSLGLPCCLTSPPTSKWASSQLLGAPDSQCVTIAVCPSEACLRSPQLGEHKILGSPKIK